MLECIFSEPVYFTKKIATPQTNFSLRGSTDEWPWNYSKLVCTGDPSTATSSTSTLPIYMQEIATGTNKFYFDQRITLGDFLQIFFVIFILIFGVVLLIRGFIHKLRI